MMFGLVQSANEITWGVLDCAYTFFVVAAAFLGILVSFVYKEKGVGEKIVHAALAMHITGLVALALALQHPLRVMHLFFSGATHSWTFLGGWFILIYLGLLVTALFYKKREELSSAILVNALLIILYLGREFGDLAGVSMYHSGLQYYVLATAGLSAALGIAAAFSDAYIDSRAYNFANVAMLGAVGVALQTSGIFAVSHTNIFVSYTYALMLILTLIVVISKDMPRNISSVLGSFVAIYTMFIGAVSMPKTNFSLSVGEEGSFFFGGFFTIAGLSALAFGLLMLIDYLLEEMKDSKVSKQKAETYKLHKDEKNHTKIVKKEEPKDYKLEASESKATVKKEVKTEKKAETKKEEKKVEKKVDKIPATKTTATKSTSTKATTKSATKSTSKTASKTATKPKAKTGAKKEATKRSAK